MTAMIYETMTSAPESKPRVEHRQCEGHAYVKIEDSWVHDPNCSCQVIEWGVALKDLEGNVVMWGYLVPCLEKH